MAKTKERDAGKHQQIAAEALQEWRSARTGKREPSGQRVAHDLVHKLFERVQKGAFRANSKIENA